MEYKEKIYRDVASSAACDKYDDACKSISSLLVVRSEMNRLLSFLIDTYLSEGFWDRALYTNQAIAAHFTQIALIPKRQIIKNDTFKDAFSNLVACVLSKKTTFVDRGKFKAHTFDVARLERKLESVLLCREAFAESALVTKLFRGLMTAETAHLFDALYHFMKRKDKRMSTLIIAFMCNQKSITFDRVPNNNELFDDIKDDCKVDLAWYIWWFLIGLCKKLAKDDSDDEHWCYCHKLVGACFTVFKLGFVKKSRGVRIGMIQRVALVMLSSSKVDIRGSVDAGCATKMKSLLFEVMEENAAPNNNKGFKRNSSDNTNIVGDPPASRCADMNIGGCREKYEKGQKKPDTLRYFDYVIYNDDEF